MATKHETESPTGLDLERGLSVRETGGVINLSPITLYQMWARGEGPPYYRVGRRIRVRLGDLLAWRDARTVGKVKP